jgi:hypothetical protein
MSVLITFYPTFQFRTIRQMTDLTNSPSFYKPGIELFVSAPKAGVTASTW